MSGIDVNECNVRFSYHTGGGKLSPIAVDVSSDELWRLMQVRLHLSGACFWVEDFTATINSTSGAVYDCEIMTVPMFGLSDTTFMFGDGSDGQALHEDDVVTFAYPNSSWQTWGLEITWRTVGKGAAV